MFQVLEETIRLGGETLLDYFGKVQNIGIKENQSNIVTQADLESERKMVDLILKHYPQHSIIAEETGFRQKHSEFTWIIDPLDGTSNFASGIPWFGVLVALLHKDQPVMAGMYLPFYNLLYTAEKGKGAFRNGEKIRVSSQSSLRDVLVAYSLDYSEYPGKTDSEARIIAELVRKVRNLRSTNSAVDFCYTADGRLGGCINQTTKIWDIAAPWLIVKEAGGLCTDINGNEIDFTADAGNYGRNFTVIAASQALYPQINALITPLL